MIAAMQRAFDAAEVPRDRIEALEATMTNQPEDRHVLAAAVASRDARAIVTSNLRHFPAAACDPFQIEVVHPDQFLCDLFDRAPAQIDAAISRAGRRAHATTMTVPELLDRLHPSAPSFVDRLRGTARDPN